LAFANLLKEFSTLYETYKDLVYNLSLQYLQSNEDAEEVSQDVFVRVYEKQSEFRAEAQWKTWIYRITVNKCLDFIKAKQRKKRSWLFPVQEHSHKNEASHFNHPAALMENKEALEQLLKAIHQLPDRQKDTVILLKIEHLSPEEVAEILQISEKALESLFQRAKGNLKKLLSNE